MGKHVHEHVSLEIDSDNVTADEHSSPEEKLRAIIEALTDEDIDVDVSAETITEEDN